MRYQTITVIVASMSIVLFVNAGVPAQEVAGGATTATRPMPARPSVSQAMLDAAGVDTKNWLHPNGSYEQLRYYAGAHIAAKTGVKDVVPVWVFQSSENYLACNLSLSQATADKLQKALDAMKRDGTHAAIVARYEAKIKPQ